MKKSSCPSCKKEIIIDHTVKAFIDFGNFTNTIFSKENGGIKKVCPNCKTTLLFNWKTQQFEKPSFFSNNPLLYTRFTSRSAIILLIILIAIALLLSWVLSSLHLNGVID